jgi:hypothetical protein
VYFVGLPPPEDEEPPLLYVLVPTWTLLSMGSFMVTLEISSVEYAVPFM